MITSRKLPATDTRAARELACHITGRDVEVRYVGSTKTTYMFKIVE